jgi:hypothetical protein
MVRIFALRLAISTDSFLFCLSHSWKLRECYFGIVQERFCSCPSEFIIYNLAFSPLHVTERFDKSSPYKQAINTSNLTNLIVVEICLLDKMVNGYPKCVRP